MLTKLVAGFFGVAVIGVMLSGLGGPSAPPEPPDPKAAAKKEADLKRYVAAGAVADTLKKALRDPDSLKFESVRVNDDASVVCAEYRAKNGFGGTNKEMVVFVNLKGSQDAATWNKHCLAPMTDQLYAVQ
jgi:hypothetical protein